MPHSVIRAKPGACQGANASLSAAAGVPASVPMPGPWRGPCTTPSATRHSRSRVDPQSPKIAAIYPPPPGRRTGVSTRPGTGAVKANKLPASG